MGIYNKNQGRKEFREQMKNFSDRTTGFVQYFKENLLSNIMLLLLILSAYGIRLAYYTVGLDTAGMLANYEGVMKHYISIGRFGVSFTKMLLGFDTLQPWELSFLTILFLYLAILVWGFLFAQFSLKINAKDLKYTWIFGAIFITSPLLAEQFVFTLQGFEVALSLNLCAGAIYSSFEWIKSKKQIYALYTAGLLAYSVGTYQSLIIIYIIAVIAIFLLLYDSLSKKEKQELIAKQIIICVSSLMLYFFIDKLISVLLDIPPSQYLEESFIAWGKLEGSEILNRCISYIKDVFMGKGIFYSYIYIILSIGLFVANGYKMYKRKSIDLLLVITTLGYIFSPFLLTIVLGSVEPVRAQFPLPFWAGCSAYLLIRMIKLDKVKIFCCIICAVVSIRQANQLQTLFYTDYARQRNDEQLVSQIMSRINLLNIPNLSEKGIVFVGERPALLNPATVKGEIIGKSYFEFGGGGSNSTGCTYFLISFFETEGYVFRSPTEDEMKEALIISKEMAEWPANDSISFRNDIIIVKLS
ncbi:MAG: hypothetical protein HFG42_18165 [Lachnospiraceae bacterium]|nr:hypothetical protein [Lachnospiraceae bacterium]